MQKYEDGSLLNTIYKNAFKQTKDLHSRATTMKLLKEKVRKKLHDIGLVDDFLMIQQQKMKYTH